MGRYIVKRLLLLIPVILGVTIFVFTIMYITPGDAATIILGDEATDEEIQEMREKLGIDKPYIVQLGNYMYKVFIKFDLGESLITGIPISKELSGRFPITLFLAFMSILVSVGVGIPLGVNAAVHQGKIQDWGLMVLALIGTSMPGFFLALLLVIIFSYKLHWLPAMGIGGVKYWILPILSSSLHGIATQARQSRSSMLEVINSDYIIMARAKGLKERSVIYKHALPNALIPVITIAGQNFGRMLGGGLIIETVFSIQGVGYYLVKGVNNRDYNVVMGGVLVLAIAFSVIMLITDLVMAMVDPRIKAQFAGKKRRRKSHG